MHIVVNRFTFIAGADWSKLQEAVDEFQAQVSAQRPEFHGVSLVREGENDAIFLVLFDDLESLNDISRNIAAPWFAEHFKPLLAGPVDRHVGEIVAGIMKGPSA